MARNSHVHHFAQILGILEPVDFQCVRWLVIVTFTIFAQILGILEIQNVFRRPGLVFALPEFLKT